MNATESLDTSFSIFYNLDFLRIKAWCAIKYSQNTINKLTKTKTLFADKKSCWYIRRKTQELLTKREEKTETTNDDKNAFKMLFYGFIKYNCGDSVSCWLPGKI